MLQAGLFAFLLFLATNNAIAEEQSGLREEVRQIVSSAGIKDYSVLIIDPRDKSAIVSINPTTPLIPASNVKVATTVAALKLLGLGYRFKTGFHYDGEIRDGVLNGNLYIKGGGDPSIYLETMRLLVQQTKRMGINRIAGNIYGDDSFFDNNNQPVGWTKEEVDEPYLAMISALSFNFNSVEVSVVPSKEGKGVLAIPDPALPEFALANNVSLVPDKKTNLFIRSERRNDRTTFYLSGILNVNDEQNLLYDTIPNPTLFFLASFRQYAREVGIAVEGDIGVRKLPVDAKPLFTHKSKELPLIIRDMNKFSSNFIANQLVKTIAAESTGESGSFEKGTGFIKKFLSEIGLDASKIRIADGSGLSTENRMTTESLVNLLQYSYNDLGIYPEVADSLSIMGVDGSVKRWSVENDFLGKIRVKTGTLSSSVSLSGYTQLANGRVVAFAMIFNNFKCSVSRVRDIEREILLTLLNSGNK